METVRLSKNRVFAFFIMAIGIGGLWFGLRLLHEEDLRKAIQRNDLAVVQNALARSEDINAKHFEWTMLGVAARYNRTEMIRLLLDRGADINARNHQFKETALMIAAKFGHQEAVQLLLNRKADTSLRNGKNHTALELAIRNKKVEIATLLEKAQAGK
jgi:ankyrin repeat protein